MEAFKKSNRSKSGVKLLIIRLLSLALLIWVASYLFIISSTSHDGPGVLGAYEDLKAERDRLQKDLDKALKGGDLEKLIQCRSRYMLFRLAYLPDESIKHADLLVAELKKSTKLSFEEKFLLFEQVATVYRVTYNFDKVQPIYTYLHSGINNLDVDRKKVMLARLENNEAITEYLKGLSTPAPSVEMMKRRLERIESSRDSIELVKKSVEDSTIDERTKEALRERLESNLSEINSELTFARLSKKAYEESEKLQK